jgi:hypothetical protein
MYGCDKAMDGNCRENLSWGAKASLPGRLAACLLLSLGIHSLLLLLQVSPVGYLAGAHSTDELRVSSRLQVFLATRSGVVRAKPIPADARGTAIAAGRPTKDASIVSTGSGISGVLPEQEPELASEIDAEIDDPRVRGFMILRLQIDDAGGVSEAEVIYAELPQKVADLLMNRFAAGRFKPAVRNGRVAEASILLRIDIY